jgi:truncated hemoglobin YjbI
MAPDPMFSERQTVQRSEDIKRAFQDGSVADATDEQLIEMLCHLCTENVPNETVRHRELLRGMTINHIQMSRVINNLKDTMQKLNAANKRTQWFLLVLTIVAVIVGSIQAFAAVVSILR